MLSKWSGMGSWYGHVLKVHQVTLGYPRLKATNLKGPDDIEIYLFT